MQFTLTLDTSDYTMRKILNLCADLKDRGLIESYTPSPEPQVRSDLIDNYEILFILPKDTISLIEQSKLREYPVIKKMCKIVSDGDGYVEKIESWGKKRLAFEIDDEDYGDYVLFAFGGDRKTMKKLDKFCRETADPKIMRHMVIRKDCHGEPDWNRISA